MHEGESLIGQGHSPVVGERPSALLDCAITERHRSDQQCVAKEAANNTVDSTICVFEYANAVLSK